ncbi:amidase [Amycolatopsis jejuensis]|uniref:amidase n=1 Tax=Amycolatopsis jejuensis TaxID=330084 RepID=UPI000526132F|nr:amidase [Amycolatopsis jejuensis]
MRPAGSAPLDLSARELIGAVRSRTVSRAEIVDDLDRRIAGDPLHVFRSCDLNQPGQPGPLSGLPVAVKDLEPTEHLPTTYGSPVPNDGPRRDGSLAQRLKQAGALVYAKTNTPAFGHKDTTDNLLGPPTLNPWDRTRTPGGSSGGAAALVAAGIAPVAHATDAAGSARIPAALCGVVGFKPTFGVVPRLPTGDYWTAKAHHGFVGRRVDDVRVVFEAVLGGDPGDPLSRALVPPERSGTGPVAYTESLFGAPVDSAVKATIDTALDLLEAAGMRIVRLDHQPWPDPVDSNRLVTAAGFHRRFSELSRKRPDLFDDTLQAIIDAGSAVTAADLFEATEMRADLYDRTARLFEQYDHVLTPAMPVVAWPVTDGKPTVNGQPCRTRPGGRWPDLLLANLTGWPAASVPCGLSGGLPAGVQILSPQLRDRKCLEFAEIVEAAVAFGGPLEMQQRTRDFAGPS